MFNVGGPEVLVILLLALIVLGPSRLPDAARQLGKMRAEIRRLSTGFQDEIRTAFDAETTPTPPRSTTPTPTSPAAIEPPDAPSANGPTASEQATQAAKPVRRRREPLRAERRPPEPSD